jgi:transcriptional regulator with XRE-family HTH domain
MTLSLEGKMAESKYRFADNRSTIYIGKQIDALQGVMSQREIANAVGWNQPAMISMIKRGEVKPPLEKIPALGRALKVDPAHLTRLVLADHYPDIYEALSVIGLVPTANENAIIAHIRDVTGDADPELTDELKEKLTNIFA